MEQFTISDAAELLVASQGTINSISGSEHNFTFSEVNGVLNDLHAGNPSEGSTVAEIISLAKAVCGIMAEYICPIIQDLP